MIGWRGGGTGGPAGVGEGAEAWPVWGRARRSGVGKTGIASRKIAVPVSQEGPCGQG